MKNGPKGPRLRKWTRDRAADTAAAELAQVLDRPGVRLPGVAEVHLARLPDLPDRVELIREGLLNLHNTDPERDSFEVLRRGAALYLLGSTPRGLLHAVYALEERLAFEGTMPEGWRTAGTFHPRERHFHPRFTPWPGERADVRFLSRLGASHLLVCHDWQGSLRSLQGYVTSPVFPRAVPPEEVARNRAGLKRLIADGRDYGLDFSLWLTELPCQGGPWIPEAARKEWLERFPAEVLSDSGTYQGKVLCFGHARVRAFYRDLLRRFFAEFPEIETIYLFGMDSGGEGCDPGSCPRCRSLSKFEQRDRLVRFLVREGGKVRPGLRVLTTGWHWESKPGEFLERQARLPRESGVYLAAESDGWQVERQSHGFLRTVREVCRKKGQLFIGYDDFLQGDDATHLWGVDLQDYPLGIGAKLARWHALEADGVFDHWGGFHEMVPSNAVACRAFFLEPLADPEEVGLRLAVRQYGPVAGAKAFRAWRALERAHRILSNACTWAPRQWPAWYRGKALPPVPETFRQPGTRDDDPLSPKEALGFTYNGGSLADGLEGVAEAWRRAYPYYRDAARHLNAASRVAGREPVGYAFWWNGEAKPPGRREHLERHRVYVELMGALGREIGLHFGLHALFERLGRDERTYAKAAGPLLREDRAACRRVLALLRAARRRYPEGSGHLDGWIGAYSDKGSKLKQSLFFRVDKPASPSYK